MKTTTKKKKKKKKRRVSFGDGNDAKKKRISKEEEEEEEEEEEGKSILVEKKEKDTISTEKKMKNKLSLVEEKVEDEDTPATVRMEVSQTDDDDDYDDDVDDKNIPKRIEHVLFSWFCGDLKFYFENSKRLYRRDGESPEKQEEQQQEGKIVLDNDDESIRTIAKTSSICGKDRASLDVLVKLMIPTVTFEQLKSLNGACFSIWAMHPSKKHGGRVERLWTHRFDDKNKRFESIRLLVDVSEREIRLISNLDTDCLISTPRLRPGSCLVLAGDETFRRWIHDSCPSLEPVFEISLGEELSQKQEDEVTALPSTTTTTSSSSCRTPERQKNDQHSKSLSWREKHTNSPEF